jgi:hypothetical protein
MSLEAINNYLLKLLNNVLSIFYGLRDVKTSSFLASTSLKTTNLHIYIPEDVIRLTSMRNKNLVIFTKIYIVGYRSVDLESLTNWNIKYTYFNA